MTLDWSAAGRVEDHVLGDRLAVGCRRGRERSRLTSDFWLGDSPEQQVLEGVRLGTGVMSLLWVL